MKIRQADPLDAPVIAGIVNNVIRNTAITFTTAEKPVEKLIEEISARGPAFQVVEINGEVVGYATYFAFRSGPGYARTMEHSVALSKDAQGGGIGRAIMARLEDVARQAGVHSLIAGVSAENSEGIKFHEAIGFRHVAILPEVGFKFGRWMDLVLMQKIL